MGDVGAFEANDKFGQLLDLVAHGEEVMITRRGRAVAHLIPTRPSSDRGAARAAMQRMRARAKQRGLGRFDWSEWKSYPNQGRP